MQANKKIKGRIKSSAVQERSDISKSFEHANERVSQKSNTFQSKCLMVLSLCPQPLSHHFLLSLPHRSTLCRLMRPNYSDLEQQPTTYSTQILFFTLGQFQNAQELFLSLTFPTQMSFLLRPEWQQDCKYPQSLAQKQRRDISDMQ